MCRHARIHFWRSVADAASGQRPEVGGRYPCFACHQKEKKRPAKLTAISIDQLRAFSKVDTLSPPVELPNPFKFLLLYHEVNDEREIDVEVHLCRACSKEWKYVGFPTVRNEKMRRGEMVAWKRRVLRSGAEFFALWDEGNVRFVQIKNSTRRGALRCEVCHEILQEHRAVESIVTRRPCRPLFLEAIVCGSEFVREDWIERFQRHIGISEEATHRILSNLHKVGMCSFHFNNARHIRDDALKRELEQEGKRCFFYDICCPRSVKKRLRPFVTPKFDEEENLDLIIEINESILAIMEGQYSLQEVIGKLTCTVCLHMITKGAYRGTRTSSVLTVKDKLERITISLILCALCRSEHSKKMKEELTRSFEDG